MNVQNWKSVFQTSARWSLSGRHPFPVRLVSGGHSGHSIRALVGGPRKAGISTIVENQIAQWQKEGGDDLLQNKGKKLEGDRYAEAAKSLSSNSHDYVHSKILADNNILPDSIVRRKKMDEDWEALKTKIRDVYRNYAENARDDARVSIEEFSRSDLARERFLEDIQKLDHQAKGVNNAIISDSLRFNGRSPVRHAKPFELEERILMALASNE